MASQISHAAIIHAEQSQAILAMKITEKNIDQPAPIDGVLPTRQVPDTDQSSGVLHQGVTLPRLIYIDCVRAIAALWVLCAHALAFQFNSVDKLPQKLSWLSIIWNYCGMPVVAFICISGFSLFLPIARNKGKMQTGIKQYAIARARRILPPYYAALAIGIACSSRLEHPPNSLFISDIESHLLLIHDMGHRSNAIVPPLWSIPVEWHIYVILPILTIAFVRYGLLQTLIVTSIIAGFAIRYLTNLQEMHFNYYLLFAGGAAAALIAYCEEPTFSRYRHLPWQYISAGAFALWVLGIKVIAEDIEFGIGICSLLIAVAVNGYRALTWRPLAFVGGYSYSLYLFHWSILLVLLHLLKHSVWLAPVGIVVSVAASYVLHLCFEKPFMKKRLIRDNITLADSQRADDIAS